MLRRSPFLKYTGTSFVGSHDVVFTPGVILPKRIFLIRHGQSLGNVDATSYQCTPDWRITLTEKGREQAYNCGQRMATSIKDEPVALYYSPYIRARQTVDGIRAAFDENETRILSEREDARLREQDISGNLQNRDEMLQAWRERDEFGRLFFRFPGGESGADASDRAASFIESFFRERQISSFPDDVNAVIVTHGLLIRLFIFRWFHLTVELFEQLKNPDNWSIVMLERYVQRGTGKRRMRLCMESHEMLNIPGHIVLDSRYRQKTPAPTPRAEATPLHILHGRPCPRSTHPDND
jgi:broad specificity phosphatase PhoE